MNYYYYKKTKLCSALGLENSFIIGALTEELSLEIKKLVFTDAPKIMEGREMMFRLFKLPFNGEDREQKSKQEPVSQSLSQCRQWLPQESNFNNGQNAPIRTGNCRFSFQPPKTNHTR